MWAVTLLSLFLMLSVISVLVLNRLPRGRGVLAVLRSRESGAQEWRDTMAAPSSPPRRYPIQSRQPRSVPKVTDVLHSFAEGCDLCGFSSVEGSKHVMITPARHKVITPGGELFFCTHHFRAVAPVVIDRGYKTAGA